MVYLHFWLEKIMKFYNKILTALVLIIGINGQALAIPIISGDATETCVNPADISCSLQTISVHNLWQANDPGGNGAQWISYVDTGVGGHTLAPLLGKSSVFTVTETFFANIGDILYLDVWADDTAEVFLNSISLNTPNFTQNICANGLIGCQPGENSMFSHIFTSSGIQTLSIDAFQVGNGTSNRANPFGLLYNGTLTPTAPQPLVLALIGLGLLGLGQTRRKIK